MIFSEQYLLSTLGTELLYLNPGTGGLIVQLLLGALFAAGLTVRIFWSRIKKIFRLNPAGPDEEILLEKEETH
jgi:hypothetical protein